MISVSFLGGRWARGPSSREPGNDQSGQIGEVVDGVTDEGNRVPHVAGHKLRNHEGQRGDNRPAQDGGHPAHGAVMVRMPAVAMLSATMRMEVHYRILPGQSPAAQLLRANVT